MSGVSPASLGTVMMEGADSSKEAAMPEYPKGLPHFETDEELRKLIQEALDDSRPPIRMDEQAWKLLYEEVVPSSSSRKLAS